MLIRTHIALTLFFILLFISNVEHKIWFVIVALLATFIADIDSKYSTLGKYKIFRFLQFFVRHRTVFHSFTFLVLITMFFVLFFPVVALPLFLGYGSHLLLDGFSVRGIRAFYPLKKRASWKIKTGSRLETSVFVFLVLIDLLLVFYRVFSIF